MSHVHRRYIAKITRKVENAVPKDLLIVCRRLSSMILPYIISFVPPFVCIFSLILSKIIIVSFILYPIVVSIAMINTVFICTVGSIIIHNPYAQAGIEISNIIVRTVIVANIAGEIDFLIAANEISI